MQLITENEAIQKVKDEFPPIRTGNDYRIDTTRTDNNVYAIKFTSQDAEGYPMKAAVTIDKRTGEFIDYIDDRSDEVKSVMSNMLKKVLFIKVHTMLSEKILVIK
ncbi:hypothetical protein VWB74_13485 [Staphylococcus aureus]